MDCSYKSCPTNPKEFSSKLCSMTDYRKNMTPSQTQWGMDMHEGLHHIKFLNNFGISQKGLSISMSSYHRSVLIHTISLALTMISLKHCPILFTNISIDVLDTILKKNYTNSH